MIYVVSGEAALPNICFIVIAGMVCAAACCANSTKEPNARQRKKLVIPIKIYTYCGVAVLKW
jgi:hypothetical protein